MEKIKKFERKLGLVSVVAISLSTMLGSGIFVLPGIVVSVTGTSAWLAYLLAAIFILPAVISKAELATAMPSSGGTYVYIDRTFGPLAGTFAGLGIWVSLLLKSAFALVGFGAYLSLLTNIPIQSTAFGFLLLILIINIIGVGVVSKFLIFTVSIGIATLFFLASSAEWFILDLNTSSDLFLKGGFSELLAATALVFVSFAGVTKIAAIAEEVKQPEKNLPRGILISLFLVTGLYSSVTYILTKKIPLEKLENNLTSIHTLAESVGGTVLGILVVIVAIMTMISMANAGILAASRFPFAMARDKLFPSFLGDIHSKYLTPLFSILFSGILVGLSIFFLEIDKIVKFASTFMILIYMFENLVVIVLRETRVQWYRPAYVSKFYPWLQLLGIVSGVVLLYFMGLGILFMAVVSTAILSVLIFFLYGIKTQRRGVLAIWGKKSSVVEDNFATDKKQEEVEDDFTKSKVLIALLGTERSPETMVRMGSILSEGKKVEAVKLLEAPEQTDLSDIQEEDRETRSLRRRVMSMEKEGRSVRFDSVLSHNIYESIYNIQRQIQSDYLITGWETKTELTFTLHNLSWLREHIPCHILSFKDVGIYNFKKILVLLSYTETDMLNIEIANKFYRKFNSSISLAEVYDSDTALYDSSSKNYYEDYIEKMSEFVEAPQKDFSIFDKSKGIENIISRTTEYDLLILVQPLRKTIVEKIIGNNYDKIIDESTCSVIGVQRRLV